MRAQLPTMQAVSACAFLGGALVTGKMILDSVATPTPLHTFAAESAILGYSGALIYLLRRNRTRTPAAEVSLQNHQNAYWRLMIAGYLLAISVGTILLWQSLYVPHLGYFMAIATATAIVAAEIVTLPLTVGRREVGIVMSQLLVLGAMIQISYPLLNPQSIFSDPYSDWLGIETIVNTGRLPQTLGYFYYFPAYHTLNAAFVELAEVSFGTYGLADHVAMISAVPFAYALGCELLTKRDSLLFALLIIITPFFFLQIAASTALLGASVMLLSVYSVLRLQRSANTCWWIVFWTASLFVFFSHPVNALILAAVLAVLGLNSLVGRSTGAKPSFALPSSSYIVTYVGYLVFMAVNAFAIFVQSLFESGPKYNFTRLDVGPFPLDFITQSLATNLGVTLLFLPAGYTALHWLLAVGRRHRFIVGVTGLLVVVPMVMILIGKGAYGLQAARTLLYLSLFLPLLAVPAMLGAIRRQKTVLKRAVSAGMAFVIIASLSTTSYLTNNGNRILDGSVPIQTGFGTSSMFIVRGFLDLVPASDNLSLDPDLAVFIAPSQSGLTYPVTPYQITHSVVPFSISGYNGTSVITISDMYYSNSGYETPPESLIQTRSNAIAYDNGFTRVYC